MQRPAAEALVRVNKALAARATGCWCSTPTGRGPSPRCSGTRRRRSSATFVADPSKGSRHNRGCAVDLTLYDLKTGKPVEMVSGYDEFSDRAYPELPGRHVAAALAPRPAAPGDGGRGLHASTKRSGGTSTTRTGGRTAIGNQTFEELSTASVSPHSTDRPRTRLPVRL